MARIAMLGTGLIGMFYTVALQGKRGRDEVTVVYGRDPDGNVVELIEFTAGD